MFDKLIDVVLDFLGLFQFWVVVDHFERGVVLRLGKYNRTLKAGFHLIFPFAIDCVLTENVVVKTDNLGQQTLTTLDGANIVLTPIVTSSICNIQKFLLDVEDCESVLEDSVYSINAAEVQANNLEDIATPSFLYDVSAKIAKKCLTYGIRVSSVNYADFAEITTIRIMGETGAYPIESDD